MDKFLSLLQFTDGLFPAGAYAHSFGAAKEGDVAECLALDDSLDAMKAASELRDASRQMGRQTLRAANHLAKHSLLGEYGAAVAADLTPCHHCIVFGMIGAAMEWAEKEMARAFLYSASAAMVGAALRLLPLGQLAGQRILWNIGPLIAHLAEEARDKTREDMWSFAPALEIASMRHATLEARLFRS